MGKGKVKEKAYIIAKAYRHFIAPVMVIKVNKKFKKEKGSS